MNNYILIRHILGAIERIESYTKDVSDDEFMNNFLIQDAVIRNLEIIGEASRKIDSNIKLQFSQIPWNEISGMRNKLVHEYFGVDLNTVWIVLADDIPELKRHLLTILNSLDHE